MSSVAPTDSASNVGKNKKNRPGKNARYAAKSGLPGGDPASTAPSSVSRASFFASQAPSDPVPQPGRFPIVFQAMGEPSTESQFAYDSSSIAGVVDGLAERYIYNPRYAEFSNHSGYADNFFERDLVRSFLLSLAQQTVHAHVNLGLTMGDFSTLASSDTFIFNSLKAVVDQFGEFTSPVLGSRFTLVDYGSTVKSLVRSASQVRANKHWIHAVQRMWIPTTKGDKRTAFIVAHYLSGKIRDMLDITLDVTTLASKVFVEEWDVFESIRPLLPAGSELDRLFVPYNQQTFTDKFSDDEGQALLTWLGLEWEGPDPTHLQWDLIPKVVFPELLDEWLIEKPTISKFVQVTSSLRDRAQACGSISQISEVTSDRGIYIIKSHHALMAPEESLLACFPPSGLFAKVGPLNAVETTPIAVSLRATEFLQLDWVS